jgi:hypothetical protein
MSSGEEPAIAPRLLSEVPSRPARSTVQPPALGVALVAETGSTGTGVGVAPVSVGRSLVAIAGDPVTAKRGSMGLTWPLSQVWRKQRRPKRRWMVESSE